MSEQIKFIISELNVPPFNKNYNLIVFDQLSGENLLQILNDVLAEIDPKNKMDIREEEPENTVLRILGMLRLLKYKPPPEISANFREGLLEGHKAVIYPVLEWLLRRLPDLKKRAYLAKYLVKIDIPPEVASDADVAETYEQYDQMVEQFKVVHKECEAVKNSGYSTVELRKDIEEMEKEKDIVAKRIERMQRKVDGTPNLEPMLAVAKKLRQEKERERELQSQKVEQRTSIQHIEQRIQRMEKQLKELRQAGAGATPEGLVQKLEEETNVNTYIVTQKLPKEIASKQKAVESLMRVTELPALGQDDVNEIKEKIRAANAQITELTEKKNLSNDPAEDKLTLFRQQAAIIGRKKESTAEKLNDTRGDVASVEEEVEEKRALVKSFQGETILRGDDFKRYVNSLRGKSNTYKKKRAEMSELRAEIGVLSRTMEVLQSRRTALEQSVEMAEKEKGVSGYRDAQDEMENVAAKKADLDEQKGKTLEDMSGLVGQLTMKIGERKARLAPIIKELRPLRQQCQNMEAEYDEKKRVYDTLLLQLESGMSRLETEVKKWQDEILSNETKLHTLAQKSALMDVWQRRAEAELKLYVSQNQSSEDKKRSVREQLLKLISDQEKKSKLLKEDQKKVKESLGLASKQVQLWGQLERLFQVKMKSLEESKNIQDDTIIHREPGTETMVL